jgi:anti-anti-sigma factor
MPKLKHLFKATPLEGGRTVMVIYVSGHIDAASNAAFEAILGDPLRNRIRNVVLDLSRVEYVNSTGISAMIRYYRDFRALGGELVLAQVPREVGLSMHYLGLTAVVPFVKDTRSAVAYFRDAVRQGLADGYFEYIKKKYGKDPHARVKMKLPLWRKKADRPKDSSVVMVTPEADVFTEILKLRLFDPAGRFAIVPSTRAALDLLEEAKPDLIVLDNRAEGADAFLEEVKINRRRGLTSILRFYGRGQKPSAFERFKVWENDHLVEPFEVMQLFRIAEAELRRVRTDRQASQHQVKFQFRSTTEDLVKAQGFVKGLMEQSGLAGDAETAMAAAVNEALQNAVQHGNRRQADKTVTANCILTPRKVTVYVEDEGSGFDHAAALAKAAGSAPLDAALGAAAAPGHGGLGLTLMRKCVDDMKFLDHGRILKLDKFIR